MDNLSNMAVKPKTTVINELGTDAVAGLSTATADGRISQYGENRLQDKLKKSFFVLFFEQLNNPLIYILLAAVAISLFLGEASEALIIAAVILLNSLLGIFQEGKAMKAIEALKELTSPKALVRRDGIKIEVDSVKLVPGDIVCLEAGRQVPADLRLTETVNMQIEESSLTGESVPVEKNAGYLASPKDQLSEQKNMAFMSTTVTYGRGEGVVVATGMETQIGKIAGLLSDTHELTPLQRRLGDLGKVLSIVAIFICSLLFVIAVLWQRDVGEMFLTAIALAVAAVPEGLPAIVTIVLALSVSGMVRVNTIVRRLPSVETLGAVNVVCSDKTGTLTVNRMSIRECFTDAHVILAENVHPDRNRRFLEACVLCNDATIADGSGQKKENIDQVSLNKAAIRIGDPTELALLDLGLLHKITKPDCEQKYPRIDERSFDSERKRMTTVHQDGRSRIAFIKGAADEMIARCTKVSLFGKETIFTNQAKKEAQKMVDEMCSRALRVLAIAMKSRGSLLDEEEMTFIGLVGMMDPARPEASGAVRSFREAHVDTIMITGDHLDTAFAIANELGIASHKNECLSGAQIDSLSAAEFFEMVDQIKVYARVSPEHKVRIVEAFKKKGRIVAMTGDGVNDAPSLKAADVGIAMGLSGTDVARNAADLVLTDDNFATIEKAIREGRGIFENIRKTILFLLSSNFGEIITMMAAILVGLPSPLKASHILWINLITDSLPALALGVDENDSDALMRLKPRDKKENLFAHGGLSCTLCYGVAIAVISLVAFFKVPLEYLNTYGLPVNLPSIGSALGIPDLLNKAQTHAFTVLAMSQLFHAIGMRDTNKSIFKMNHLKNRAMLLALAFGFALQILVTEIPYLVSLFGTVRLSMAEWLSLGLLSLAPLLVHELLIFAGTVGNHPKGIAARGPQ
ncbi:MAG: cation-translocating P-type ATPase [Lachnospiraceae bacterium]|nr:cation-translocating P-type ATPase [Lachnospiraceae bacterium]